MCFPQKTHSAFPIALRKGRGKLGDWEVGAMIGFVLSLASSYGNEGVPLGTLIAGYILCVQRSKWNALQQARQERYICAIVCSLCEQDALRASKHTPLTLLSTVEAVQDVDHNSSPLHNTMILMSDTWLQWCYEEMIARPQSPEACLQSENVVRMLAGLE